MESKPWLDVCSRLRTWAQLRRTKWRGQGISELLEGAADEIQQLREALRKSAINYSSALFVCEVCGGSSGLCLPEDYEMIRGHVEHKSDCLLAAGRRGEGE